MARSVVPHDAALRACLAGFLSLWMPAAAAQQSRWAPPSNGRGSANAASGRGDVREVRPAIHLKDKDGDLVLVPDLSFEEFDRLVKLDKKLSDPQPPPYVVQSLSMSGAAKEDRATLQVEFRILVRDDGWVRIPLKLHHVVLREPPQYAGPGACRTSFEEGDGYVCWLQGVRDAPHVLTLNAIASVLQAGDEWRLSLNTPQAASSQLTLRVNTPRAVAAVSGGAHLLAPQQLADGQTELTVLGLGGDVELAWREGTAQPAKTPEILEADGLVLARIEGQQRMSCEAKLEVRSLSAPIDSFFVRLPKGMQLLPAPQPGCQLLPAGRDEEDEAGSLVEVKLNRKTAEAVSIRLLAESKRPTAAERPPLEVAGFEVLGAVRQRGFVDFVIEGDWSVRWEGDASVQRREEWPEELRRQRVAARFEYFRHPWSIKLEVLKKEEHVRVEPTYKVHVGQRVVRLEALLAYRIRGARADPVEVNLKGWTVERILPETLVQGDELDLSNTEPLAIPLVPSGQTSPRDFELQIFAHQEIPKGADAISFTLPKPVAKTVTHASVIVQPEANVDLTARPEEIEGLLDDSLSPAAKPSPPQQAPLVYVGSAEPNPSRFAADFFVRQRSVSVALSGQLQLDQKEIQVEQRFGYRIASESLRNLVVDVPQTLLETSGLTVSMNGEPLLLTQLPAEQGRPTPGRKPVRVGLGDDHIGACELLVRYCVPLPDLRKGKAVAVSVPIVSPSARDDATVSSNTLQVLFSDALRVAAAGGGWNARADDSTGNLLTRRMELSAEGRVEDVPLTVALVRARQPGATAVRRSWVQTWLSKGSCKERAALRFATREGSIQIQLPRHARLDDVQIAMDGAARRAPVGKDGVVRLPVAGNGGGAEHVVELWYGSSSPRPGKIVTVPPYILGADQADRFYWQLATPQDEHLLLGPSGLTPELQWQWRGLYCGRQSNLQQRDLETWVGATEQTPPPEAANQYLFTSFEPPKELVVFTASRRLILLAASGAALLAGLLMVYCPVLRHPGVLLAGGLGLLAASILVPELSLLAAQAASMGLVLALLGRVLDWIVVRRRLQRATIRGRSYPGADAKPQAAPIPRSDVGLHATTVKAPLPVASPAPESES